MVCCGGAAAINGNGETGGDDGRALMELVPENGLAASVEAERRWMTSDRAVVVGRMTKLKVVLNA